MDGTIKQPEEESPDLEDWWTNNSLLVSWIMNTIEPALRSTISHMEVARDLWEDIKERFSVPNGPRIQQLKVELIECKQKGLAIVTYFGRLKRLWEELGNYDQIPECKCGKCICNLGGTLAKKREEEKVHQFLMGLDEVAYGINNVQTKEERGEVMSFAIQAVSKSRNKIDGKDKAMVCSHYGRQDMTQIVAFNWLIIQIGAVIALVGLAEELHISTSGTIMNDVNLEGEKVDISGLNSEQWQTLMHLLHNAKIGATELFMNLIIDTGASHHMTGSLDYLFDVRDIVECSMGLPDGNHTTTTKEGTMVLCDTLKLTNVFYVPNLHCNLISVSQLIDESNCPIWFTNEFCVIQDHTLRMVIGVGERREVQVKGTNSLNLWHKRLGHPSFKVVGFAPHVGKGKTSDETCDICLRAKQTRDGFPISESKVIRNFQLIHCDLWGPYKTTATCGVRYFLTIVDDHSRAVWIYLLIDKKEVSMNLHNFLLGRMHLTARYLINRTPSMLLQGKTPYEILHSKSPSLDHLRVFGCLCYVHNQNHKGDKFASRSRKCVFMGYPYGKKGWRVYDTEANMFLISQDVAKTSFRVLVLLTSKVHLCTMMFLLIRL
ncbi:uncharacterized protein LOC113851952 [Abrus precatorius]|uniref:Uncharacterized protein LOC113851952 n=1 Tax=Abrus precatorius TaxID=3816 RepID=A0A8B8K2Z1_ABRPR|nr:uncharacterized protein LOC113851952 [Abrus precatorius]